MNFNTLLERVDFGFTIIFFAFSMIYLGITIYHRCSLIEDNLRYRYPIVICTIITLGCTIIVEIIIHKWVSLIGSTMCMGIWIMSLRILNKLKSEIKEREETKSTGNQN